MSSLYYWGLLATLCAGIQPPEDPAPNAPGSTLETNRQRFYQKLASLQWFDYTPSTFDPLSPEPVRREDIVADLRALIDLGLSPTKAGLCTYSCSPREGTDQVPRVARELGFAGMLVGVWAIDDERERDAARRLAKEGLVDAICLGNEGLESRYEWPALRRAMQSLRVETQLPVSTSEQIDDYGARNLTAETETDFIYPNIHPVFRGESDVMEAAGYVTKMVRAIRSRTTLPVLVHETGWPSSGLRHHTPENQREFWSLILKESKEKKYSICIFECFSQSWKHEVHQGADVGTSWGWFDADRKPKPVAALLVGLGCRKER
jgi:exo-beta-1,3-glucanase (GH17 family)